MNRERTTPARLPPGVNPLDHGDLRGFAGTNEERRKGHKPLGIPMFHAVFWLCGDTRRMNPKTDGAIQLCDGREPGLDRLESVVRVSVWCPLPSMASPAVAVNQTPPA